MEKVLKVEYGAPRPLSKCIGVSADAGTHRQVRTTQLYLKEVGSDNVGAPARQSRHACVPPYPMEFEPANSLMARRRPFIDLEHMPYDVTDDVTR